MARGVRFGFVMDALFGHIAYHAAPAWKPMDVVGFIHLKVMSQDPGLLPVKEALSVKL
jgi:hypothetical protein